MKIRGKTAVVTGASSGIGRAVATALANRGARVGLVARRADLLQKITAGLSEAGGAVIAVPCDVTHSAEVADAYARIVTALGRPDILVNAAGVAVWKPFMEITTAEHRAMMDVNYWGAFNWIRASLPDMLGQGHGAIVNISSGAGKVAFAVTSGYSASKFAVTGLSEALHRDVRQRGVRVSCIHPGSVRTDFWNEQRIPPSGVPPLVRYSPKLSPASVARTVCRCLQLGFPVRTMPVFLNALVKANAIWIRLGDVLLWRWFVPVLLTLVLLRVVTGLLGVWPG